MADESARAARRARGPALLARHGRHEEFMRRQSIRLMQRAISLFYFRPKQRASLAPTPPPPCDPRRTPPLASRQLLASLLQATGSPATRLDGAQVHTGASAWAHSEVRESRSRRPALGRGRVGNANKPARPPGGTAQIAAPFKRPHGKPPVCLPARAFQLNSTTRPLYGRRRAVALEESRPKWIKSARCERQHTCA